ncbi:TonB-dependent receptor (plasmid) [Pedobacter sp. BS3]|uniref:SusC/RagA family TonB-linked outer membrane protein n=1 Tax=Pedobacter sp. BS3 TaxID=2567937 RepID=UPI0011EF043F|nr:TonB-dependent receptor [Pedobacter sp. BS3]TZF85516.1 TonB-dependent receptor [Pedobacter sp. BS3]
MSKYLPRIGGPVCVKFISLLVVFTLTFTVAFAQTRTISGRITDAKSGEILPGVSIRQKGQPNGTTSDASGHYSLRLKDEKGPVLVFTSIGFVTQEIPLEAQQTSLNVKLVADSKALDEVVVVGYGSQKKESVVAAIVQTSGDNILRQNVPEVANALSGLLPGLATIQSTSLPGGSGPNDQATQIFIRGQSTWNGASPLILVDGVERSIDNVDAFEIDKISILKDASATAVFGVKGANGVILITTKRGRQGTATLNVDAETMINTLSRQPTVMNSYDGNVQKNIAIVNEMAVNPSSWQQYKPQQILNYYKTQEYPDLYPDVNWLDEYTRNYSTSQRANINVNGGTKFAKYFGSLSYLRQGDLIATKDYGQGYTPSFTYDRFNFRSNVDFNITSSTRLSVNLSGLYGIQKSPNGNNSDYATFWKSLYGHPPDVYPVRYSDGTWGQNPSDDKFYNGITAVNFNGVKSDNRTQINTDLVLDQKLDFITKGFSVGGRLSMDSYYTTRHVIADDGVVMKYIPPSVLGLPEDQWDQYAIYTYPTSIPNGYNYTDLPNQYTDEYSILPGGSNSKVFRRTTDYQVNFNYARTFGKHDVSGLALFKRSESAWDADFLNYREDWVGRITYGYDSKYLVEINAAYNGSEKFDRKYRFGFFPSMAFGWVISNEKFFKKALPFVDQMKFRYSNGWVGNDQDIKRWQYVGSWNPLTRKWTFGSPFEVSTGLPITLEGDIPNPNIHWETAHKQNVGVDAAFFKDKLNLTFDYYWARNTDVFVSADMRTSNDIFGAALPSANLGEVKNQGWELDLAYRHQFANKIGFDVRYTQSFNKNKILAADDAPLRPDYQKRAGYSIGQIRTQLSQGIMQSWDEIYTGVMALDNTQRLPGDFRIIDFNADGYIDNKDAAPYAYNGVPQYTHSLNLGFNYKGFNAGILFYGAWNVSFVTNHIEFNEGYTVINDFIADASWNPAAGRTTSATYPGLRLYTTSPKGEFNVEDASYTRIKSAELGYSFNKSVLKKLNLSRLQVFLRGYNLALWSKMREDRESQNGGLANRTLSYPLTRSYTLGLAVGF